MPKRVFLVSVSGGKDSQACWNYIGQQYPDDLIVPYFADTGWEHDITLGHLGYLSHKLGKITRIASDKYTGLADMCVRRKAFPTRQGRFCTIELKLIPSIKFIREWQNAGYRVINVVGVRAEESKSKKLKKAKIINGVPWKIQPARDVEHRWKTTFLGDALPKSKKAIKRYYKKDNAVLVYQPIVDWKEREVYEYNLSCGTKNNPLYALGSRRVGCMPCIFARQYEIGNLNDFHISKVRELEAQVAVVSGLPLGEKPTFFQNKDKGGGVKHGVDWHVANANINPLGMELGCVNHLGICE